jgi:hypothetical protein
LPSGPRVRDAMYLLGHDADHGFRRCLHPSVLELALAAAVLGDLVLLERVELSGSGTVMLLRSDGCGDVITDNALMRVGETLRASRARGRATASLEPLEMIRMLAPGLLARTRAQLLAAGTLVAVHRRFGRLRCVPADQMVMGQAWVPARTVVRGQAVDPVGMTLCVLVQAVGLHESLYLGSRSEVEPLLGQVRTRMTSADPPLSALPIIADALREAAEERAGMLFR